MAARKSKAVTKKASTDIASIQEQIAKQAAQASDSVGSTSGGNRLRVARKRFVDPDGNEYDGPLNLVILDFNTQNMYYEGAFDIDNPQPPVCFALNEPFSVGGDIKSMVPSENSPDPQSAEGCASCVMNQFGSRANGKGKACKNQRMLAVVNAEIEDSPIMLLSVMPSALRRFDTFVRTLAAQQRVPITVVTEVSLDQEVDYPSLIFKPIGDNHNLGADWARLAEAQALLRQEPDLSIGPGNEATPPPAARRTKKKATARRRSA